LEILVDVDHCKVRLAVGSEWTWHREILVDGDNCKVRLGVPSDITGHIPEKVLVGVDGHSMLSDIIVFRLRMIARR
jgi:hypothetical protein